MKHLRQQLAILILAVVGLRVVSGWLLPVLPVLVVLWALLTITAVVVLGRRA